MSTLVKAFAWETSLSHEKRLTNVGEMVKTWRFSRKKNKTGLLTYRCFHIHHFLCVFRESNTARRHFVESDWRQNCHNLQNNDSFCNGTAFSSSKISFGVMTSSATYATFRSLTLIFQTKDTLQRMKDVIIYNVWDPSQFCLCVLDRRFWVCCGFSLFIFSVFENFAFYVLLMPLIWNLPPRMHTALQFAQYQDPLSDSDALQYFLQRRHWNLGSFRYLQPEDKQFCSFWGFEAM